MFSYVQNLSTTSARPHVPIQESSEGVGVEITFLGERKSTKHSIPSDKDKVIVDVEILSDPPININIDLAMHTSTARCASSSAAKLKRKRKREAIAAAAAAAEAASATNSNDGKKSMSKKKRKAANAAANSSKSPLSSQPSSSSQSSQSSSLQLSSSTFATDLATLIANPEMLEQMGAEIMGLSDGGRDFKRDGAKVMDSMLRDTLQPGSATIVISVPNCEEREKHQYVPKEMWYKMAFEEQGVDELYRDTKDIQDPLTLGEHVQPDLVAAIKHENQVSRNFVLKYGLEVIAEFIGSLSANDGLKCFIPKSAETSGQWFDDFIRGVYVRKTHDHKELKKKWDMTVSNDNLKQWYVMNGFASRIPGLTVKLLTEEEVRDIPGACFGIE